MVFCAWSFVFAPLPMTTELSPPAYALVPIAMLSFWASSSFVFAPLPIAIERSPLAAAPVPKATASVRLALAFTPAARD